MRASRALATLKAALIGCGAIRLTDLARMTAFSDRPAAVTRKKAIENYLARKPRRLDFKNLI